MELPPSNTTVFQTWNNTDIFRELLVNNTAEFISSNTDIFREFLPNQTIVKIFSKYVLHNNDTFKELLPNNIDLFRTHQTVFTLPQSLYQKIVSTFLKFWMDTWKDKKFSSRKFSKLACRHQTDNFVISYY